MMCDRRGEEQFSERVEAGGEQVELGLLVVGSDLGMRVVVVVVVVGVVIKVR